MFLKRLVTFMIVTVSLFGMALWPTLAHNGSKISTNSLADSIPSLQSTTTPTATITIYLPALMHKFNPADPSTPIPTTTITPTVSPTITPTLMPTRPPVEIIYIEYAPVNTITGEYVDIKNNQTSPVDMTKWTLSDAVSNTFTFPSFILQPQAMVRVWGISGTNDVANLYWGRTAIWNNDKDTAILRDAQGMEIHQYIYPIATPTAQPTGTVTVTPIPTAIPTINPNAPKVKIIYIEYAPVNTDADREYVDIQNNDTVAVTMTGWKLSDEGDTTFTFPTFTLQRGAMVRVWVITGTNDATNLYWGRTATVWNNDKDAATLKDTAGAVVDYYSYVAPTAPPNLPTGTPPVTATVKITHIEYSPAGSDLDGEYVDIKNVDTTAINLTNWSLHDAANTTFKFPIFSLDSQATVRVWVKAGTNDASNLYWGSTRSIWNNTGEEEAVLRDPTGNPVYWCIYTGQTGQTGVNCP